MENSHGNSETIGNQLHTIIDRAQALVDATSGELDEQIKSARAALKERLHSAKHAYDGLEGPLMNTVQTADNFIHAKPYYAMGGTLITGLLVGWFLSRK